MKKYMTTLELKARVAQLETAIKEHRNQKADDRCIFDDDKLYEVLGDGIKCDRHVGSKEAMLENCKKFIEKRCQSGVWSTYAELEEALAVERDWTQALSKDLDLLKKLTDPEKYNEASKIVGRLTHLEEKNLKLEEAIKSRIENIQDYLADCKSPGTKETLENELEYLERVLK